MDWIIIIIFALGLPVIGGLIGVYLVSSKYYYIKSNPQDFGLEEEQEFRKNFGKYVVFQQMFVTAPIYGLLILILFWSFSRDLDTASSNLSKLGVVSAMAIGVPGLFCNISRGLIMREGFVSVVRDPKNFGRAIVQVASV
ncbi:MAG: hypothetical protein JSV09_12835 [Thermoplasmata archaeon]|nr:MAG: hypothetical protein JSV09_12835 [Thermoplasmata archaeon]